MDNQEYNGPERRKGVADQSEKLGSLSAQLEALEKIFNHRLDSMERKIDDFRKETKEEIERINADTKNSYLVIESRQKTDFHSLEDKYYGLSARVKALEEAPMKKVVEERTGFLKKGKELATNAVWLVIFGFVGFLILDYLKNGGVIK